MEKHIRRFLIVLAIAVFATSLLGGVAFANVGSNGKCAYNEVRNCNCPSSQTCTGNSGNCENQGSATCVAASAASTSMISGSLVGTVPTVPTSGAALVAFSSTGCPAKGPSYICECNTNSACRSGRTCTGNVRNGNVCASAAGTGAVVNAAEPAGTANLF